MKRVWHGNVAGRPRVPAAGGAWHRRLMAPPPKPAGRAPTRAQLHEAALRHLSRFATTEAGLVRVLDRRVQRWARAAAAEGQGIEQDVPVARADARLVARALVETGVIDDAAFAAARAARLVRAGRSRRATSAHLLAKGVPAGMAHEALPGDDELPSALAFARRRRIGPFRGTADAEARVRDMGALARAGFPREVAERALAMDADDAAAIVLALKRR